MNEQDQELYQLFGALCNETITPSQHEQLQEILLQSANARQLYLQYIDLHLELGQWQDVSSPVFMEAANNKVVEDNVQKRLLAFGKNYSWLVSLSLLAVIAVAIGIPVYFQDQNQNSVQPVQIVEQEKIQPSNQDEVCASVLQTSHVRFAEGGPALRVGTSLEMKQQYALVEGEIQILFTSGAEVILEGPAIFELQGKELLNVDYGICSVYAPPGAEGFVVKTPLTKVVDLGTRFSVNVHEGGETDVQVVEGKAEVFPIKSVDSPERQAIQLTKGTALRFDQVGQTTARNILYNQDRYSKQLPDRVVTYTATPGKHGGYENLTSITVQRGGKKYEYQTEELIGIKLVYFKGSVNSTCMTTALDDGDPILNGESRLTHLETDRSLVTGLINPGGTDQPLKTDPVMNIPEVKKNLNTPGMAIRFNAP